MGYQEARHRLDLLRRIQDRSWNRLWPRVPVFVETPEHVVKTAEGRDELVSALRLRYRVFYRELAGRWLSLPPGLDVDGFDFECDHLVIVEKATSKVIGTYRLICSAEHDQFYSATEFELGRLLELPGTKVELGRACVDSAHRTGAVIGLLWRGIAEYVRRAEARWLFGCTSLKTTEPREIQAVMRHLRDTGRVLADPCVAALPAFACPAAPEAEGAEFRALGKSLLPKLFLSYLRAGAKVCSLPAIDRVFRCTDLLTLLDVEDLSGAFSRRFELGAGGELPRRRPVGAQTEEA